MATVKNLSGDYFINANTGNGNVIIDAANLSVTGNVTGTYYFGNGAYLTGISGGGGNSSGLANGTTSVTIPVVNGNVVTTVDGVTNVMVVSTNTLTMQGAFVGPKTISSNIAFDTNVNALLIGPISLAPGFNIFVPNTTTVKVL